MKYTNVMKVGVAIILLIVGWHGYAQSKDEMGRLICQIIDPDTGKPVNERFVLELRQWNNWKNNDWSNNIYSNSKGEIDVYYAPGEYVAVLAPYSSESKYAPYFFPFYEGLKREYRELCTLYIKIEKGKITKVFRHTIRGGGVRVKIIDQNGVPVDRKRLGKDVKIEMKLVNQMDMELLYSNIKCETDELVLRGIFPELYRISFEIMGVRCLSLELGCVLIKRNEVVDLVAKVQLEENTGIYGVLRDQRGNILSNAKVHLIPYEAIGCSYDIQTDEWGRFGISTMRPGLYMVLVNININRRNVGSDKAEMIKIEKGIVKHNDIVVSFDSREP